MNNWDYFAVSSLSVAIIVNTLSVYAQKRWHFYDRFGKNAWLMHRILITVFWGLAVLAGFGLKYSKLEVARGYIFLGLAFMVFAVVLFVLALRQIGAQALGNGNFFGQKIRELGGVYKLIKNPIYKSYVLWYLGLVLATGKKTFIFMALIAAVGLSAEAYIEKL